MTEAIAEGASKGAEPDVVPCSRGGTAGFGVKEGHLPMVALYWFEKRLLTYWFMSEVLPTLRGQARCVSYDARRRMVMAGLWLLHRD